MGIFLFMTLGFYGQINWTNEILSFEKEGSIYVATMEGVYKSNDSGNSFKPINNGFFNLQINSIEMDKNGRLYAGCDDGIYVLKKEKWEKIKDVAFVRKILILDKTIFVGTGMGKVLKNNGKSWDVVVALKSPITGIASSGKAIYISSYNDGIYKSCDLGITWKKLKFEGKRIWDILPNGDPLFVASEDGLFKGSNTWKALNYGLTTKDIRVIKKDKNILYLGSYIGGFFISYDSGKRWNSANTRLSNTNIRDIEILQDKIYLATENGLYKTEDKGASFQRVTQGLVYLSKPPLSKSPDDIRKRKEKLGIKPPPKEGEKASKGHGGAH
ncbi:MAG: hypothetical protein AB1297_04410 [bacterium]